MKTPKLKIVMFFLVFVSITFLYGTSTKGAVTPYDVPSSMSWEWNDIYGGKQYDMNTGKTLVYDVYSKKYITGGYRITSRDFGNGMQPYLNFTGWSAIVGRAHHTSTNHSTYIVAKKVGTTTTKIYRALPFGNLDASSEIYNYSLSRCSSSATNRSNASNVSGACNMDYKNVGFSAYIPMEELFSDPSQSASWKLYIVKDVNGHVVYTPLILPFDFDNKSYYGGTIKLTSGVNANSIKMVGYHVLRRTSAGGSYSYGQYFTENQTYTRIDSNEDNVTLWHGVISPHDNNQKRWAASAYWLYGGDQAEIQYTKETSPPYHVSDSISGAQYVSGNDYWVQPNTQLTIDLRQRDTGSGNQHQYIRLYGSGADVRSRHDFLNSNIYYNNDWMKNSGISIDSARRLENTSYGKVSWGVTPKISGKDYNLMYYYRDLVNNHVGYNDTGKNIRVDGDAPEFRTPIIEGVRYIDGTNYWVQPGDNFTVNVPGYETRSGWDRTYLRFYGSGNDNRAYHDWDNSDGSINEYQITGGYTRIYGGTSPYYGWSAQYKFNAGVQSNSHGKTFNVHVAYHDNVHNSSGYMDSGLDVRVDGEAPSVTYSPNSQSWTNSTTSVGVSVSDPLSGVKRFRYKTYHDGVWGAYSSYITGSSTTITLSNEGTHRIVVEAEDNAGNISYIYSGFYYLDKTLPTVAFRNSLDTADFTSRDWSIANVQVRMKFSDVDSGYKRSRYYWSTSSATPTSTQWSAWTTSSNYLVSQSLIGEWYLHVQLEDHAGNVRTTRAGLYKINSAPSIQLSYNPNEVYQGDNVSVCVEPTDLNNQLMNVQLERKQADGSYLTVVNQSSVSSGNTVCYDFIANNVGQEVFRAIVTDGYDPTTISITINVNALTITGEVNHTDKWLEKHVAIGNLPNEFYSGEKFLLKATISSYPINYVKVLFKGTQENGSLYTKTINLTSSTSILYLGELYDEAFAQGGTSLKEGSIPTFTFEAQYQNGIIKKHEVPVKIIGDVFDVLQIHRTY